MTFPPEDIFGHILSFLEDKDAISTSSICHYSARLFSHKFMPQRIRQKLLNMLAFGQREKARSFIESCQQGPEWFRQVLLGHGHFIDCGDREFLSASAWEYVLWARDRHSWELLLPCLEAAGLLECAFQQLLDLEKSGLQYRLGNTLYQETCFDLDELPFALNQFVMQFQALWQVDDLGKIEKMWTQEVSSAQARSVAHIRQEYCYPGRTMDRTDFNENSLPDVAPVECICLQGNQLTIFNFLSSSDFENKVAVVRGNNEKAIAWKRGAERAGKISAVLDRNALRRLAIARTKDYVRLKENLELDLTKRTSVNRHERG